jgi:hypothetical protein
MKHIIKTWLLLLLLLVIATPFILHGAKVADDNRYHTVEWVDIDGSTSTGHIQTKHLEEWKQQVSETYQDSEPMVVYIDGQYTEL